MRRLEFGERCLDGDGMAPAAQVHEIRGLAPPRARVETGRVRRRPLRHPGGNAGRAAIPRECALQHVEVLVRDDTRYQIGHDRGGAEQDLRRVGTTMEIESGVGEHSKLRRLDPVALGEEGQDAGHVGPNARLPSGRDAIREHKLDACGAGLPPPRAFGEIDQKPVPVVQLAQSVRGGRGTGPVMQESLRLGVPLGGADESFTEARKRLGRTRSVLAEPSHQVATGLQRQQHAGRGGGARPHERCVAPEPQPHAGAGYEPLLPVPRNPAPRPAVVALTDRIPHRHPLERRYRVEELGDRRVRTEPGDHPPTGKESRRDRCRRGRRVRVRRCRRRRGGEEHRDREQGGDRDRGDRDMPPAPGRSHHDPSEGGAAASAAGGTAGMAASRIGVLVTGGALQTLLLAGCTGEPASAPVAHAPERSPRQGERQGVRSSMSSRATYTFPRRRGTTGSSIPASISAPTAV